MSDFGKIEQKTVQGVEWRGTISVVIDGEDAELSVRQLVEPEFREVMSYIDTDELKNLRGNIDDDMWDEYQELQQTEERTEEQNDRLAEITEELESDTGNIFDTLSDETFKGLSLAAKYGVEPDDADLAERFRDPEYVARVEKEYGIDVRTPDDLYKPLKDDIAWVFDNNTDFLSFTVGIQVLLETGGDEKNSSDSLHRTTGLN